MSRATIGINLLWLVPGEVGGSEQSTVATVRGLIDLGDAELSLRLFVRPAFAAAYPELVAAVPTDVAPIDGRSRARRILTESMWLATQTKDLDLVHHAGGTVPPRRSTPVVLTLHDLQPLEAPMEALATHSWLKRRYLSRAVPAAVRASRRVAVPSEFVRRTVLDQLSVAPARVEVIPHAVPVRPLGTPRDVLVERHRLSGPVVLYPAITYPHKDHTVLLRAFEGVLARHPRAVLVLPGGAGPSERAVTDQIAASPGLRQQVRRVGRIPEADLSGLLELADVVAVPSRYEGFGLPALEAMAAGTPVVAADATSLPEVVGGAGRLVPVGAIGAWSEAISDLLADDAERARLTSAGLARAAAYTTTANAIAFAQLYRGALGRAEGGP
ncbi:MAG: glycosyltransferase family 1 protein [Acidimicrobiales bacterium]